MMSADSVRTYGLWGVRGIFILVFAVSGIGKLLDSQSAANLVELLFESMPVVSAWADTIIVLVSGGELLLVGVLTRGWRLEETLWIILGVITSFTALLATLLGREDVASCGCFGAFGFGLSVEETILRNLSLMAFVLGGIVLIDSGGKCGVSEARPSS